ncbi:hypothetical protein RV12_GL002308 [Enterococcus quebecensis]|nr:hypothetical protein RV12_GL002308 [Enterococcus quebecensis]
MGHKSEKNLIITPLFLIFIYKKNDAKNFFVSHIQNVL